MGFGGFGPAQGVFGGDATFTNLTVPGAATFAATVTATGQFLAGNGTAAAPSYSFTSDPDSGIYRSAADTVAVVCGGGYGGPSAAFTINGFTVYQYAGPNHFVLAVGEGNAGVAMGSTGGYLRLYGATNIVQVGGVASATPVAQTFTVGEASRPGTDTNVGGASGTIRSGLGTGTGTPSTVKIQGAVVAASGSTAQTYGTFIEGSGTTLGFYGVTPIARAVLATGAGRTVDDVITALQNLGLVKQS